MGSHELDQCLVSSINSKQLKEGYAALEDCGNEEISV